MRELDTFVKEFWEEVATVLCSLGFRRDERDGERYVGKWSGMVVEIVGGSVAGGYEITVKEYLGSLEFGKSAVITVYDNDRLTVVYDVRMRYDVFDSAYFFEFMSLIKIIDSVIRRVRESVLRRAIRREL